jgi:hypothetical protein
MQNMIGSGKAYPDVDTPQIRWRVKNQAYFAGDLGLFYKIS